jgi:signal transduction histidine kinase
MNGMHLLEMLEYMKETLSYDSDWEEFKVNTISNLTDRIAKTGKLIRKDNSVILFSYIPLPDGAHMLSYIDITDTYVVENAVMEKNNAIKEANRLKYEFISSISSELKEPINALIGFTELLSYQYYGLLNEKQQEYCKYILDSSNQLHQLVNNLLEMVFVDSESAKLEPSKFAIIETINEVLITLEKRAKEKGIEILPYFEDKNVELIGDRKRIKQCLFNIFINFIQATPINEKIEVRTLAENGNLKIIVKSYENSKNINNRKKTYIHRMIESNTASTSMVKSLIDMHGGTFNVTSDIDGKSCVVCCFPIKNNKITNNKKENSGELWGSDSENNEEKHNKMRNVVNA